MKSAEDRENSSCRMESGKLWVKISTQMKDWDTEVQILSRKKENEVEI